MCFVVESINPDALIAKEDIICYKSVFLRRPKSIWNEDFWLEILIWILYFLGIKLVVSASIEYVYILTKYEHERVHIKSISSGPMLIIEEGYHSWTNIGKAKSQINLSMQDTIIECIIPKGTIYYVNKKSQEYVSENIITRKIVS